MHDLEFRRRQAILVSERFWERLFQRLDEEDGRSRYSERISSR